MSKFIPIDTNPCTCDDCRDEVHHSDGIDSYVGYLSAVESAEGTMGLVHKLLIISAALIAVVGTVCLVLTDMGVSFNG